ncbi:MAG TPA: aromatic-ring-hydroxylating dioxygenase subunit beta [Burkholderiaceae bacterium]|nr:aromatic-ring-hydroxylating dioxygenase subunit beta [Burkholderiaceae bacterium]
MDANLLQRLMSLNASYARCIDDDRIETWPDFFADDCIYRITTAENYEQRLPASVIYARSKGMLRDRVSALREASVYERQRYRHIVGVPTIDEAAGGDVRAESPFVVVRIMRDGSSLLFASGRYVDRLIDAGAELKLAERVVVCDSSSFDTLLALPL